jgi:hypothetical protein
VPSSRSAASLRSCYPCAQRRRRTSSSTRTSRSTPRSPAHTAMRDARSVRNSIACPRLLMDGSDRAARRNRISSRIPTLLPRSSRCCTRTHSSSTSPSTPSLPRLRPSLLAPPPISISDACTLPRAVPLKRSPRSNGPVRSIRPIREPPTCLPLASPRTASMRRRSRWRQRSSPLLSAAAVRESRLQTCPRCRSRRTHTGLRTARVCGGLRIDGAP